MCAPACHRLSTTFPALYAYASATSQCGNLLSARSRPAGGGYHKRLKAAAPLLAAAIAYLARQCPSWYDPLRLIDATPVPCGASRETVRRSELAGWAHYGYCAAHSRW
jgi:hypothetical protein